MVLTVGLAFYAGDYGGGLSVELLAALVGLYVLSTAWDRLGDVVDDVRERLSPPGPSAIEQLQEEYERGDLTLQEFEQRAELALDDRAAVVVDRLEVVDGVGPDRAAAVADSSRISRPSAALTSTTSPTSTASDPRPPSRSPTT